MKNNFSISLFFFPLFFVSLFLFSNIVYAQEITYSFNDTDFDILNNLDTMKNTIEAYNTTNGITCPDYTIFMNNTSYFYVCFSRNITNVSRYYLYYLDYVQVRGISSDFLTITGSFYGSQSYTLTYPVFILYSTSSSFNPFASDYGDTLIFSANGNSFSIISNTSNHFPSLYEIHETLYFSPPDDFPLLTSFFTIFSEKLVLLCDYITSSYVCLSIFVVFIIYFVILLFRRLK